MKLWLHCSPSHRLPRSMYRECSSVENDYWIAFRIWPMECRYLSHRPETSIRTTLCVHHRYCMDNHNSLWHMHVANKLMKNSCAVLRTNDAVIQM